MTQPESLNRCGDCEHSVRQADLMQIMCWGVPPTPIAMGAQQGPGGQVAINLQLVRPVMPAAERACALFKRRNILKV